MEKHYSLVWYILMESILYRAQNGEVDIFHNISIYSGHQVGNVEEWVTRRTVVDGNFPQVWYIFLTKIGYGFNLCPINYVPESWLFP